MTDLCSSGDVGDFYLRVSKPEVGSIEVMDVEAHDVGVCRTAFRAVRVSVVYVCISLVVNSLWRRQKGVRRLWGSHGEGESWLLLG